ncbi:SDR family NAD(P)-dependent oxidoreductase [Kineococcus rhizosphaerae]|uniref:NADP-dependent 3-hydroxy acid dehydrogenase YdfG n=1 Tax=Kineococcus rhizosphaerae TaxID=559628 RepID=A0A2T0RAW6_9ACTN|nr:SDR family NAD(P)-dependent oxidoreductase [Kineococcus rhizosphaerae]PRY18316.1 NADP-dependent 3-hydroxy acid dehydrogenase YdfG [Kineococcus rhizosphaerae]
MSQDWLTPHRGAPRPVRPVSPGDTAVVTGGASGIGLGIAEALLDRGLNVVIADVRGDHLEHAGDRLRHHGARLQAQRLDVSDPEQWRRVAQVVVERFGGIDLLCLNAGIGVLGTILRSSRADWHWLLGVNLAGVTNGVEAVLPAMRARGSGGRILATSSAGGLVVAPDGGVYSASKFGVVALMDCLRAELAPDGIGVTTLYPAGVNTNIHDHETMRPPAFADSGVRGNDEELHQQQEAARRVLARAADPADVGRRVLAALDRSASHVFTDGGIRSVLELRRDALRRAAAPSTHRMSLRERQRILVAEPDGPTAVPRLLRDLGHAAEVLDVIAIDGEADDPARLSAARQDASSVVVALDSFAEGGIAAVDWVEQVHERVQRCFTTLRGLVPQLVERPEGGRVAIVLPVSALSADPGRCADSVSGRTVLGLAEGLRAELLGGGVLVSVVLAGDDEPDDALADRIDRAVADGPMYSLPPSFTSARIDEIFAPWLDELSRTISDVALPPLGPQGEVYREAAAGQQLAEKKH